MKMYNAAKYLLSKDVQVVPLNDNKKPTVAFKNVTIDDDFIDHNFLAYSNTNVLGVLTRGLWCIDIDI
ncbi:DNA primase, partial [Staphylococcus aureus]